MRFTLMVAAVGLVACGDDVTVPDAYGPAGLAGVAGGEMRAARSRDFAATEVASNMPAASAIQSMQADQKLIRSGQLNIEVRDAEAAMRIADSLARQRDAFVADTRISRYAYGRSGEFLIRVPSTRFDEVMADLRTLGDVRNESVTAEDVTREYADLGIRLAVKEEAVARLRSLLNNRTGALADVLAVERELSRAVTELEQLKGEQRYYDQRIAVSTIAVTVFEPGAGTRTGLWGHIRRAFEEASEVLGQSIAMLVYLVVFVAPWALLATVVAWPVVKRIRARTQRATAPPAA